MRSMQLLVVALFTAAFSSFVLSGPGCLTAFAQQGGADAGWETMSIPGATVRFEMPKPIKMDQDLNSGMVVYVSKKNKISMKVGIVKRNADKDKAQGLTDEKVLDNFALRTMAGNKLSFKKMGFETNYQFGGNLKLTTGVGKQYNTRVGKAFVLNRFYINSRGLYYVEAITQDTKDPDINRFLKSFTP